MLLAQEPDAIEHLPRACPGALEPLAEERILHLQLLHPLRVDASTRSSFYRLHASFCAECAPAEASELVAKVSNQLLKLLKRFEVRTFAV